MTRSSLHLLLSTGLLLGAACGDDPGTSSSNSNSEGATEVSATEPTNATETTGVNPTAATEPTTGMTGSMSSTDDPSSSTTTQTSASSSGGETGETTEGVDPSTTTAETAGETMTSTGEETAGEDTTTGDPGACPLAVQHEPCDGASDDALHALGLNCTTAGPMWKNNENAVSVAKLSFQAPPAMGGRRTWQVAKAYGTHIDPNTKAPFWGPREGEKVLLISTGLMPGPNGQGVVVLDDNDVYNDAANGMWDSDSMPPPMSPQKGSPDPQGFTNCDGTHDCSNTLEAQWELGEGDAEDKMWFSFELKAPAIANGDIADAKGYTFDFAYFSAEFPEYVDSNYNDIFVVWQASEAYTGNVTFIDGQPLTVTALWPVDFDGNAPELAGTGFNDDGFFYDSGATGWYKATGGVTPGETFTLAFAIFDMGDSTYDTTAILDNWQWDCEGCVPNEVNSCGIEPQ